MKINTIVYSSDFRRAFKKLPKHVQQKAVEKEKIFRNDCFNPLLKTHKLKGSLKNYWSFWVNYSYRILFKFRGGGSAGFADIGSHSIYR